jgi:hypothetical protein
MLHHISVHDRCHRHFGHIVSRRDSDPLHGHNNSPCLLTSSVFCMNDFWTPVLFKKDKTIAVPIFLLTRNFSIA